MLSTFYEYLLNRPAMLRIVGSVLWRIGCFGLLAGALAAAVTAIFGVVASMTGSVNAGYQQMVPGLPTWWIPESPLGVSFYLTLMLVAFIVNNFARELQRALKY